MEFLEGFSWIEEAIGKQQAWGVRHPTVAAHALLQPEP